MTAAASDNTGGSGSGTSLEIAAGPEAAGTARAFLRELLGTRLDPGRLRDLELIVTELVNNAVLQGSRPGDTIEVAHEFRGPRLCVSVIDPCRTRVTPTLLASSGERESGRGLLSVDRLADEWGDEIVQGKRRVWAALTYRFGRPVQTLRMPRLEHR